MNVNAFTAVDLDLALPTVRLYTRQCDEFLRQDALRFAARDFLRRSFAWRQQSTTLLTTVPGQSTYAVGMPIGLELVAVHAAWLNGKDIGTSQPGEEEDEDITTFDDTFTVGVANIETLRTSRPPATGGLIVTGTVSIATGRDSTAVPSWLMTEWQEELASGAICHLCTTPGSAWSNPGLAQYHGQCFERAILEASTRAGPVKRTPLRVRPA